MDNSDIYGPGYPDLSKMMPELKYRLVLSLLDGLDGSTQGHAYESIYLIYRAMRGIWGPDNIESINTYCMILDIVHGDWRDQLALYIPRIQSLIRLELAKYDVPEEE